MARMAKRRPRTLPDKWMQGFESTRVISRFVACETMFAAGRIEDLHRAIPDGLDIRWLILDQ